jgi:diguanylate cyclase (GGDEF)-like protein
MSESLTVLVVDDQEAVRVAIALALDRLGHRVIEAGNALWALELFGRHRPDVVLLDVEMPGQDGYWVARQIRESEQGQWTPIIFLSAHHDDQDLLRGIEAGGDDYLMKPASAVVIAAKMRAMQRLRDMQRRLVSISEELRQANLELRRISEADQLTGLLNRRGLERVLATELRFAQRERMPLSFVLCDVDHFKAYNDNLGHLRGDECLQRVGELLRRTCMRPRDVAARYGGEEFALVLPNTPKSGAMTFVRALQRLMAQHAPEHPFSPVSDRVTLSGGITTCVPDEGTTPESLLMRADEALYAAKERGRNRFFSFEMQLDSEEQR